jgi:hypothetical protein
VQVSTDNTNWVNARTGITTSLGLAEQTFDFPARSARWVRYLGHGNTVNAWNSVTEINIYELAGESTPTPTPTATATPSPTAPPTPTPTPTPIGTTPVEVAPAAVSASTNDGNVPANAIDGSLATRWSASGEGQWLQLNLGAARTVTHVTIATYNGNQRQGRFDLQTSTNGTTWSTVLTNAATSGTTLAEETFDFGDVQAQYVRYLGHGNSVNAWNSLTEVSVFAVP